MAVYEKIKIITAVVNTGTVTQYEFVKISGANGEVINGSANTDFCIGVAQEGGAADATVPVAIGGIAKVLSGASITRGTQVTCHTDGTATTAASGDQVQGIALSSAASGDVFDVLITPSAGLLA